ncbi:MULTISPECIES: PucR family transcriptional regulator [unclassified Nocardioides]|uniref:PucR family transcriptional regulator n=1 Tax=unclassified Nocardioides TaxID=2615069 RepID=UPI00070353F6|nr:MULTISPECIES: helix-turn-helix domain-containing protein [unclassified Nocardioides]KQQ42846.1 hypothetical protein ASF50_02110 [Nocardioides sp. Leaf307]
MDAETLAFLGDHRAQRLAPLTDRLVATIEASNPGYQLRRVVPSEDLRRSCHDNIDRVLELLGQEPTGSPAHDPAYDAARETGRRRAEQGLPLDDVLRSFRMGGRLIWDDLVDHAEAALTSVELRAVGGRLWEVVDETSAQVAAAYHAHERAVVRADEQQRAELWEGLLSGRAQEASFAFEAARILDLPVSGDVIVAIGGGVDPLQAGSVVAPHASAWVRRTGGVVGLVALREDSPREALQRLERVAAAAGGLGVSAVVHGLAGVDTGFRQASLALRTLGRDGGLATFDSRLPEALLMSAPDVAARLVSVWLGPLLALPRVELVPLVDTLEAWVATGGSATSTAERVHCHRNTVLNRLRRVGELTGRDVLGGAPPVELDLALRALRTGG